MRRLCLGVKTGQLIVMTAELWCLALQEWFYNKRFANELLHTYMYMSMLTQTGKYALYFHTVWSHQVTFVWTVRGNVDSKWTCQWLDDEEDSGSDKLDVGGDRRRKDQMMTEEQIAKNREGENIKGQIKIGNFLWVSVSNSVLDIMK